MSSLCFLFCFDSWNYLHIAGDLIHAGMNSPDGDNIRIHIIMKTKEFQAGGNEQGWMKERKEDCSEWVYEKDCDHTDRNHSL